MQPLAAPTELGRGAVILPGQAVPSALASAPVFAITSALLQKHNTIIQELHSAWAKRQPVVIELHIDTNELVVPESLSIPLWQVESKWWFPREQLKFLIWANNADCRHFADDPTQDWDQFPGQMTVEQQNVVQPGIPMWWHGVKAKSLSTFSRVAHPDEPGDIKLTDGRFAWVDGGPRGFAPTLPANPSIIFLHRQDTQEGLFAPMGSADSPDDALSDDQRAAVNANQGAVRVIAPAGSGKTRVLTARINLLLHQRKVPAHRILALVYNNRAAKELRERVGDPDLNINTVHAWALNILRTHLPSVNVMDEWQPRVALSNIIQTPPKVNVDPIKIWLNVKSFAASNLADPAEIEAEYGEEVPDFVSVMDTYRDLLRSSRMVDFDEMVYWATELLLTNPEIRAAEQARADVVLVDEFQDLTPLYMLFIRLLAAPELQVFGVGDDDQVIYGFGGANPDFLINFDQFFPGAVTKPLTTNYRCPKSVIAAANTLLAHNAKRVPKQINPSETAAELPVSYHNISLSKQGSLIGVIVKKYIDNGAQPKDIAVLSRITIRLLPVLAALHAFKIPVQSPFDTSLLSRAGIKTVLAYLRIGCEPDRVSSLDLSQILHKPLRAIPGSVRKELPSYASLAELKHLPKTLTSRQMKAWAEFISDLQDLAKRCATRATEDVIRFIIDDLDIGSIAQSLETLHETIGESGLNSHIDDLDVLKQVASLCPKPAEFEQYLNDLLSTSDVGENLVTLSTVHKVKGLEWPHVIVTAVFEGVMPHRLADTPETIEEERRVFHVAITRASKSLDIVQPDTTISRFSREMQGKGSLFTATQVADGKSALDAMRGSLPIRKQKSSSKRPKSGPAIITAAVGLEVGLPGGIKAKVVNIDTNYAHVKTRSGAVLRVNFGEVVNIENERRTFTRPR